MKFRFTILTIVTAAGLLLPSGCTTSQDPSVPPVIKPVNTEMIGPYLERPGSKQPSGLESAIKELDARIAANPDQSVTVNQYRVRQAMLLTVNAQENRATKKWAEVDASALKTERDQALYKASGALVWAYKTLPQATFVRASTVTPHVQSLDAALKGVSDPNLKIYLNTVRAETQLKLANSMDEERNKAGVENVLATSLQRFVDAFPRADQQSVQSGAAGAGTPEELRHRVWLRELIRAYRGEAEDKNLSPNWKPAWIGTLALN